MRVNNSTHTFLPFRVASETPRIIGSLLRGDGGRWCIADVYFIFFAYLTRGYVATMRSIKLCAPLIRESKNLPCEQRAIFHAHVRGCEPYVTHILRGGKKGKRIRIRTCACIDGIISHGSSIYLLRRATLAASGFACRLPLIVSWQRIAFQWFRQFQ